MGLITGYAGDSSASGLTQNSVSCGNRTKGFSIFLAVSRGFPQQREATHRFLSHGFPNIIKTYKARGQQRESTSKKSVTTLTFCGGLTRIRQGFKAYSPYVCVQARTQQYYCVKVPLALLMCTRAVTQQQKYTYCAGTALYNLFMLMQH